MKIAFSTIACPSWTLADAVSKAREYGFLGLEMRSFHDQSQSIASDPFTMAPGEIAGLFDDAGVVPLSLGTSVRYDKPINPPVIGRIFQNEEEGVGDTKLYVDLADRAGIDFVRVFGCTLPSAEPKSCSMVRVTDRLKLAAQTARNTKVRVLLENAGSFATSTEMLKLIEMADSTWLDVSYNTLAAVQAGECPLDGVKLLGDRIKVIKISDIDSDGNPALLGQGELPIEMFISALGEMDYTGWIVYEYPKLWQTSDDGRDPADVLKHAADTLYGWMKAAPAECTSCAC